MRRQIEERLQQLKVEFESGQKLLLDLEERQTEVKNTLLRIQGAIQVLEEELVKADEASSVETATEGGLAESDTSSAE
ncbi:MAG: hypothetical protein AAGD25_08465 [Cyanobacteria bacterium P01_F01_bin.150]